MISAVRTNIEMLYLSIKYIIEISFIQSAKNDIGPQCETPKIMVHTFFFRGGGGEKVYILYTRVKNGQLWIAPKTIQ